MSTLDEFDGRVLAVVQRGGVESGGRVGVSSMTVAGHLVDVREIGRLGARAVLDLRRRVQGALRRLRDRGLVESPAGTGLWLTTDAGRLNAQPDAPEVT